MATLVGSSNFPSAVYQIDRIANHRSIYLDYEGPLSGDRGWVSRRCAGEYFAMVVGSGGSNLPESAELAEQINEFTLDPRETGMAPLNLKWLEIAISCGLPQVLEMKLNEKSRSYRAVLQMTAIGQAGKLAIGSSGSLQSVYQSKG